MRKVITAINMTLDGYCDHTAITSGEGIHEHYADLLNSADAALYGRVSSVPAGFSLHYRKLYNPIAKPRRISLLQ